MFGSGFSRRPYRVLKLPTQLASVDMATTSECWGEPTLAGCCYRPPYSELFASECQTACSQREATNNSGSPVSGAGSPRKCVVSNVSSLTNRVALSTGLRSAVFVSRLAYARRVPRVPQTSRRAWIVIVAFGVGERQRHGLVAEVEVELHGVWVDGLEVCDVEGDGVLWELHQERCQELRHADGLGAQLLVLAHHSELGWFDEALGDLESLLADRGGLHWVSNTSCPWTRSGHRSGQDSGTGRSQSGATHNPLARCLANGSLSSL